MATSKPHVVLHVPVPPPVEVGGDQAEAGAGEQLEELEEQLEEECPAFPLPWEEEREEEVDKALQDAGHRGAQLPHGSQAAEVDPGGEDEEGVEDMSSALPGEAEKNEAGRK